MNSCFWSGYKYQKNSLPPGILALLYIFKARKSKWRDMKLKNNENNKENMKKNLFNTPYECSTKNTHL